MESRSQILERNYSRLPNEIKEEKRWVCYNKANKIPMNALSGQCAASNNPLSWTTFNTAIAGCIKYNFDGIGFMLGNGIFGIDLDNHANEEGVFEMSPEEFNELSSEFITSLNSYSEKSQSGKGIHIICKGKLPAGARRKGNIEMYDSGRYFAMTGDVVNDMPIENREEEVKALWEKYLKTPEIAVSRTVRNSDGSVTFGNTFESENAYYLSSSLNISDSEIVERIKASKNGLDFIRLYVNGDLSQNGDDHSSADLALCTILAFWCDKRKDQMDRIFRNSALMREKWNQRRGQDTYGNITLDKAINSTIDTYTPKREKIVFNNSQIVTVQANNIISQNNECESNLDENGDPIITTTNKSFKIYSLDDTGNAERFYDYFGHLFKYNSDNKIFMFWNNKTWVPDTIGYIKKYADALIKVLRQEASTYEKSIQQAREEARPEEEIKKMTFILKEMYSNITRISNKAGKEAMLSELQHLHTIPVSNNTFNVQEDYLNTESGVVDLVTGEILPFDKKLMLSKNTNCRVSYEEPKVWLSFLRGIFARENPAETEELINCVQKALGYSITGRTNKDMLFVLYGEGSNGKSTFIETVNNVFGDYGKTMNSSLLIQNPNSSSQSTEFALSALYGARFVSTSETAEGKHLDEVTIKQMTSGEKINAQEKYGKPYSFKPSFSPWMSTNNKPIIRATDWGTWRRIFLIPFLHIFKDKEKDINMPKKLAAESAQILGWIIQGNVKLLKENDGQLQKPKCVEEALADYKNEMNVLSSYLSQRCQDFPGYQTQASVLYQDYKEWARNNTEWLMSETKFGREMSKRGYEKKKTRNGIFYIGLKLFTDTRGHIFSSNLEDDD